MEIAIGFTVFVIVLISAGVRVVPQQQVFVIERFGKYLNTLNAGIHFIVPLIDKVAYKHSLKEEVMDIPPQVCITRDNVQVDIDGVLFFRVLDAFRASYGVTNYIPALIQLAQTTLRSEVGKMDLDKAFEEREAINAAVVDAIDKASDPWGTKVLRYEIKSITPPRDVLEAMEKQVRAEREKRAVILESEGFRDAKINEAEGKKQEVIKESEADMQRQINEAHGQANAILAVADATAQGIARIAKELETNGGKNAATLRIAQQYLDEFGQLAKASNTMIIPASVADLSSMIATATSVFNKLDGSGVAHGLGESAEPASKKSAKKESAGGDNSTPIWQ